jgi:hypothetical protein
MALLPPRAIQDPTLAAVDKAMEEREARMPRRTYLGMSAIGGECSRKLWYSYHQPEPERFNAATLRRFADGHRSEDLMADRLRLVDGITFLTLDPESGRQFEVTDLDGRFKGHMDGVIKGILQAPHSWHVWEGKCVNEKKFAKFQSLKQKRGEKETLKEWDPVYYAQAQCYMGYAEMSRHYLTVCTPGGRDWDSCRTEFNKADFEAIKDKAKRILEARVPLAKISNDPNWHVCKWCHYSEKCHGT